MRLRKWFAQAITGLLILLFVMVAFVVTFRRERPYPGVPHGIIVTPPPGTFDGQSITADKDDYNVLILSAGGARGAFGAGALTGWSKTGKRPEFDLVTGVSVGSLQSVFAFAGSEYDSRLEAVFSKPRNLTAFTIRDDAVYSDRPFRQLIEANYDRGLLERVAARHRGGARLLVGTTNLDRRDFHIWDMGAIAASGDLAHFQKVLVASCTVPVAFPPVYFEVKSGQDVFSQLHVDGGAYFPLFLPPLAAAPKSKVHVHTILNHFSQGDQEHRVVDANVTDIAVASLTVVLEDDIRQGVYRTWKQSTENKWDYRIMEIPAELLKGATILEINPAKAANNVEELFAVGEKLGEEEDSGWLKQPTDVWL